MMRIKIRLDMAIIKIINRILQPLFSDSIFKYTLVLCLFFSGSILTGCQTKPEAKEDFGQPNIIVMYSDDHTAQSIGAYQDVLEYGLKLDHTPTPNIDRLAEEGMRFDN